jgi:hypothetical protein
MYINNEQMGRCKHEQTTSISWASTISENQVVTQTSKWDINVSELGVIDVKKQKQKIWSKDMWEQKTTWCEKKKKKLNIDKFRKNKVEELGETMDFFEMRKNKVKININIG